MAKKRKDRKQPRRTHLRSMPTISEGVRDRDETMDQPLFQGLRQGLRSEDPIDLLQTVSSMVTATDPRMRGPFDDGGQRPDLAEVLDSFADIDYAETTAALMLVRAFSEDDLVRARIGKALTGRRQPMPAWLAGIDEVEIGRVEQMTHVLGDGDDYFLEARLPGAKTFVALVYVDHNLGTVVKDAFLTPGPFEQLRTFMEANREDEDQVIAPYDAATARAILTEAIDHGAMTFPPLRSDTWPGCRPVVEWLVRQLPAGGEVPARLEWSEDDLAELRADFFASPFGAGLDRADERSLLESVNWFGTDYGPGDPLRWSPVNVEMLLADWVPRKIVAEQDYLAKLPALLRAFVRYCHHRRGLREEHTADTLGSVDHWEPEYLRLIADGGRPQGAEALARMLLDAGHEQPERAVADIVLEGLDRAVGGREALLVLDDRPLPEEAFADDIVPEDIRDRVAEVRELCDRCAEELFDVEHRTAMRRMLARAAANDPAIFRRRSRADRAAAAVAWAIASANRSTGQYDGGLEVQELLAWFGVKGSVSQRAGVFLAAIGVDPADQWGAMSLGSPDYLTGERRADIIETRDRWLG